jgi:hypothetical protein
VLILSVVERRRKLKIRESLKLSISKRIFEVETNLSQGLDMEIRTLSNQNAEF